MELYKEILAHALTYGQVQIIFPGPEPNISKIVEGECYKTLKKIKAIIEDDSLEDKECFMKIEQIVLAFEEMGSNGGIRHDFG